MSRVTPKMRLFAKLLIAHGLRRSNLSGTKSGVAFYVPETLRPHLATLLGNTGYSALLSRALALASAEVPWLRAVNVQPDGSLEGWNELAPRVDPQEIAEGSVVLVAHLLGLLVAFVGDDLTLRLVGEAWPRLPLHESDFGKGENHEKAK
jgi:hypothetical protein